MFFENGTSKRAHWKTNFWISVTDDDEDDGDDEDDEDDEDGDDDDDDDDFENDDVDDDWTFDGLGRRSQIVSSVMIMGLDSF